MENYGRLRKAIPKESNSMNKFVREFTEKNTDGEFNRLQDMLAPSKTTSGVFPSMSKLSLKRPPLKLAPIFNKENFPRNKRKQPTTSTVGSRPLNEIEFFPPPKKKPLLERSQSLESTQSKSSTTLKTRPERELVVITGSVQMVFKNLKLYPDLKALYEVYGSLMKINKGKIRFEHIIFMRNESGPVLQGFFYDFENILLNFQVEVMENKTIKNNESSASFLTSPSETGNSFKFVNSTFAENSDSSVQVEARTSQSIALDEAIRNASKSIARDYQISRPAPNKILPSSLCKVSEEPLLKDDSKPDEKTLAEIGFKPNKIEGWESINQPKKQDLYGLLKNMIDNYHKTYVQIRVGEVTFNCHMMVLQCYSEFFMDCSNEAVVQLPTERITPQAFMMVYDWMLSAEPLVQREGILELFNAANFLKIKGLVDQCWVCLDDDVRFQEDTAFLLYLEARNYGLETLQQLMLTRMCKFFLTLVASKDFLLLSVKEICTLLSSNSIGVNSEVEILMSAVRWLSYDWKERECHMIDVLNSVRFGLMAPWILVALGRDIDCEDVQRVIDNAKVKKMIEDGLSYTTTQLYYSKDVDNFLAFMERYKLTKPVQRQWICDQECGFHHKTDCPNRLYITYNSFLDYLEMIRSKGKDHWKTLHMEHQEGLNFQCCLPKANTSNDKYFVR